ncbi:PTS fructose transporter subunit IIABC [Ohessyouella blattaphilus]|uniref:Fructose-specific PTS transporter subunit EIIC n=1 Tax=Ohessyouella blattaphilus TaxID=2949333 RepID=A0ABT1EKY4_9FIRM|nr:fructose-specific PTS transporter subunit EIIC [Ohessyouella blattaphilus]MCP1111328.1 fructose-specific PTS transporter subunit EIIC [Ohessyouella blattaphilus]MCR8564722.1 fructose-specific PTS transporter subunit EIIC [Ohessyouella blattaphilus]
MRITDLLEVGSIELKGTPRSKKEALDQMVDLMVKSGKISDTEAYRKLVYAREEESTTGIGEGVAIPHGKGDSVKAPGLSAMVVPGGVEFDALDGEPVELLFLIAAPNTEDNIHLDVLSKLSMLMMDEGFINDLKKTESPEEFLKVIDLAESKKDEETSQAVATETSAKGQFKILGVTSCPTGIAHTYMAAEGIEKAAKKRGCFVKVETRGSGGAKNVLTEEDIREADCIIVAADAQVPMDRFDGKRVIECPVSDGISKGDALVEQALSGNVPIYKGSGAATAQTTKGKGSIGHQIYIQLMNGVSHMLPFVVGGGILIALAFLIDGLSVDMNALSAEARGNFGSITPVAKLFKDIGGVAFGFMLPVLSGFIAMAIGDRPALAVGFVGGMIASGGKSGFLGALVAGFVAGYLIVLLRKACDKLPQAIEKIAPVLIYPVVGILFIGLFMNFAVEPVMGGINTALNNGLTSMGDSSKLILGGLLAAMMAIDMGGPFNKAAYVFGTASIASGNFDVMAAVMIGGMVPPCAIALATILFKNKFTKEERDNGPMNFIMGLAFITEGAIPYAAADPIHVLPSCMIGSGVAGALSMLFNCTLMAPHGGIFVVPVVGNALLYLVALVVGTIVSAVLLGTFKKKVEA